MIWLSHPGVLTQTHYDTQQNFLIHISGVKRVYLFPPSAELYQYPNIHRSYRQSQAMLECRSDDCDSSSLEELKSKFPNLHKAAARVVDLHAGDVLHLQLDGVLSADWTVAA